MIKVLFGLLIVVVDTKNEEAVNLANDLYDKLNSENISVILDDRNERCGVKFNDLDLIGIPFRITIGKSIKDGKVELKKRCESDFTLVEIDNVIDEIKRLIQYN